MAQTQLSDQDQRAWEIYCDEGGKARSWEEMHPALQQSYRQAANEELLKKNQPWRHP